MSREKVAELRIWRAEMVDTTGALILQIPANLSDEDRDHAVEVLELVIRQLRRETGGGRAPIRRQTDDITHDGNRSQ